MHTTLVEKEVWIKLTKLCLTLKKKIQNFVESDGDDGIDTHDHKKSNGFSKLGALKEEEEDQVLGLNFLINYNFWQL